jgi:hypothetical protein
MEASRRRPVGGAARLLVEQSRSAVEEQSKACFVQGSEKRRQTSLGVELHGDKDERHMWTLVDRQHRREVVGCG